VPLPSSVTIKQTGEGSAAHILGNIGTDATLVFDQTGSETNYTLDVTLNLSSSLALNQISDGGVASGLKVVVPIGQTITITQ
jgi:hypothetical protein